MFSFIILSFVTSKRTWRGLPLLVSPLYDMSENACGQTDQEQECSEETMIFILEICRNEKHLVSRKYRSEVHHLTTNLHLWEGAYQSMATCLSINESPRKIIF
jgi:hypothetical protein